MSKVIYIVRADLKSDVYATTLERAEKLAYQTMSDYGIEFEERKSSLPSTVRCWVSLQTVERHGLIDRLSVSIRKVAIDEEYVPLRCDIIEADSHHYRYTIKKRDK